MTARRIFAWRTTPRLRDHYTRFGVWALWDCQVGAHMFAAKPGSWQPVRYRGSKWSPLVSRDKRAARKSISMLIGRIDGPRRMGLRTQRLSDPFGFVSGNGSPVTKASPTSHRLLNCRLVCGPSGEHRRHTGQPSGFLKRQHLQFSTRESRAAGALRTPRVLTAQACSARNEQTI